MKSCRGLTGNKLRACQRESQSINWRKNAKNSYDGISLNKKYDFNIRKEESGEEYKWVVDVFDHSIKKDHNKAYIDSFGADSFKEAKEEAQGWI